MTPCRISGEARHGTPSKRASSPEGETRLSAGGRCLFRSRAIRGIAFSTAATISAFLMSPYATKKP